MSSLKDSITQHLTEPIPDTGKFSSSSTGPLDADKTAVGKPAHKSDFKRASERRARTIRGMIIFLLIVTIFSLGFIIRGDSKLMDLLGVPTGLSAEDVNPGTTVTGNTANSISARVAEVEGILALYSLDSYDLDTITSNVLGSLVETTEDSNLRYFTQSRYEAYVKETSAVGYSGIGVLFAEYKGQAYAVDVFEGSTAQASGVQTGDFVVAINGDRTQDWTTTEVANALLQADGTSVVITWRRPAKLSDTDGDEFTTELLCTTYTVANVTTDLADRVGYIGVKQLTANSAVLVSQAIRQLEEAGAAAFILDLRDCPGGYLTQAVELSSLFIKSGTVVQIKTRDGVTQKNASGNALTDKPLYVLINENTAGAAEVVCAALQDSGRAQLVGTLTLGKGSVQVIRELSFGGALRYTVATYFSPFGTAIEGMGVTPQVTVIARETQLTIALDLAKNKILELETE